jgi:beta-aspartyl-dipeptidase (metallo-type)
MYPTHISSRGQNLIEEGKKWIAAGGFLDFTADGPGENETLGAILEYYYDGVDLSHLTLSSDSYGYFRPFDQFIIFFFQIKSNI